MHGDYDRRGVAGRWPVGARAERYGAAVAAGAEARPSAEATEGSAWRGVCMLPNSQLLNSMNSK